MWVRTNRRAPGADWRDSNAPTRPGPWHLYHEHGLTWCGRKPGRIIATQRSVEPPEGQRRCAECERAKAAGRPKPYRRR